jgi:formylglycine-generating enzyme required for sulfatase activity
MRRTGATALLLVAGVVPAISADVPPRKAGLWELKVTMENAGGVGMTFQQCLDAETDRLAMSSAGPIAQEACPKHEVQHSGDTLTIDSTCTVGGKPATSHVVITGSLDSAYTMTMAAESEAVPGGKMNMTTTGKYLGACAADQKPGDMILGNGIKMNILESGIRMNVLDTKKVQQGAPR